MRKISGLLLITGLIVISVLNMGTVRRKQSAVSKSQTSGIKLKDKLEELKDGEKGPATPTFGWYGGTNHFMGDPPYVAKEEEKAPEEDSIPAVSEVELPSRDSAKAEDESEKDSGWDDDWASQEAEDDEALPAEADNKEDADQPAAPGKADTSKGKEASKWDKDWWDEI